MKNLIHHISFLNYFRELMESGYSSKVYASSLEVNCRKYIQSYKTGRIQFFTSSRNLRCHADSLRG